MSEARGITIQVAAQPEAVFAALTDPISLGAWFAEHTGVDLAAKRYDFWGRHTPGNPGASDAAHPVVANEPGRKLAYRWHFKGEDSHVTFELEPSPRGTLVTVSQRHPEGRPLSFELGDYWCLALQNLRSFVERGEVAWRPDYAALPKDREVRIEVETRADPATVFRGLTDPAELRRWIAYSGEPGEGGGEVRIELAPGGAYDLGWDHEWGRPVRVLQVEPDRRLVIAWADPTIAEQTVVTWELEGSEGGTRITLIHSGFAADYDGSGYYGGWADFVVRLRWMTEEGASWQAPKVPGVPIA